MTLLVVSLFLPYTVNFDGEASSSSNRSRRDSSPVPVPTRPPFIRNESAASIPGIISSLAQARIGSPPAEPSTSTSPLARTDSFLNYFGLKPLTSSDASTSPPLQRAHRSFEGRNDEVTPSMALPRRPHRKLIQPSSRATSPVPRQDINSPLPEKSAPNFMPGTGLKPHRPERSLSRKRASTVGAHHRPSLTEPAGSFDDSPWHIELYEGGNGGLRNAVKRAETEGRIKNKMWIGTLGMPTDALSDRKKAEIEAKLISNYDAIPVLVDDNTLEGHYTHYCKQILWPTLHYQVPDNPKSKAYEDHSWVHYRALNQIFADKIVDTYEDGDIIWINDYHLLLVPGMVREKLPHARIGFFLHVAFPSSEVFRCLAARRECLEGMLGANCIGFQIAEYSRHFLQTCNRILAVDTTPEGIKTESNFVSVVNCAIGVDISSLDTWMNSEDVEDCRKIIRERWAGVKLIVARDKLDKIRGVKQKLLAYEEFLRNHPEWIEGAVMIQIGLDSVPDPEYESEIYSIVDRINSMRADLTANQPVLFFQQYVGFEQYLALLAEASVFVVSSLREGMNLTCHEYVYCNRHKGPLILSEFTGSASVLGDDSLLVNPWDKVEMAELFHTALTMSDSAKSQRWGKLYSYVINNTCGEWLSNFVGEVEASWVDDQQRRQEHKRRLDVPRFLRQYGAVSGGRRMFFLNMDTNDVVVMNRTTDGSSPSASVSPGPFPGSTPVPRKLAGGSSATYVSPQRKISVLSELVADPNNIVYVISRESRTVLERTFRQVTNIGLIAEGGAFLRPCGEDSWVQFVDPAKMKEWQSQIRPMLDSMSERLSSARISTNESNILFDVSSVFRHDPDRAATIVGELINAINDSFAEEHVHARLLADEGRVLIGREDVTDARAVERAYELECGPNHKPDYLFVASMGSDCASETYDTLFDWAHQREAELGAVCTVSVGTRGTLAKWTLEGINGLLNVLLTAAVYRQ